MRGGTVLQLKWSHIEQDFNNRAGPIAIRLENSFHVGRKKSGFTFIGDRARQLIGRSTETSKSERGYRIYTESDCNIFPYSYDSILTIVKTAKDKAQLHDPALSPIHSFRKFFREQLTNAEIHPDHIKVLFGRFAHAFDAETAGVGAEHAVSCLHDGRSAACDRVLSAAAE